MKRTYDGMESLLTKVQQKMSDDIPEWARQYVENCIYFPQLGFLTVVQLDPNTGEGKYKGEGTDEDEWSQTFVSDEKVYYKNKHMREMDEYIGDMYSMITGQLLFGYYFTTLTDCASFIRQRDRNHTSPHCACTGTRESAYCSVRSVWGT